MLNNKKLKTLNKIGIIICLCLCFAFAFFIPSLSYSTITLLASDAKTSFENDVTSKLFNNYNFNHSSSTRVYSPSSWSKVTIDGDTNSGDYLAGVVNFNKMSSYKSDVELSKFWDVYGITSLPINSELVKEGSNTEFALMINAKNFNGRMGYKPSKNLELEANSYYKISLNAMSNKQTANEDETESINTDSKFSIYLSGFSNSEIDEKAKFETESSESAFSTYTFYIATGSTKESLKLEFWLGGNKKNLKSNGAVFLSDVSVTKYSENAYFPVENDKNIKITLNERDNYTPLTNLSFENNLEGWTILDNSSSIKSFAGSVNLNSNTAYPKDGDNTVSYVAGSNFSNTSKQNGLLLSKYGKGIIGVQSDAITIDRFGLYELNVWSKTDNANASDISIELLDLTEDSNVSNASIKLSSTLTSNDYTNNWTKNTFRIKGDPHQNREIAIKISINSSSDALKYAFFDDVTIYKINATTYSNLSNSSTEFSLDETKSIYLAPNYSFNYIENENTNITFPLKPASWTETTTISELSNSGIVNSNYAKSNAGNLPEQISSSKDFNNFLMIDNLGSTNTITFKSTSISLESDSYYKISFYAKTSTTGGNVKFKLYTSSNTLYSQENILATENWKKYTGYIKTSTSSETAYIDLTSDKAQGEVYFDEIIISKLSADAIGKSEKIIDYSKDSFEYVENGEIYPSGKYQQPYTWTASSKNDNFNLSNYGVVDTNKTSNISIIPTAKDGSGLLYIKNNDENYLYYKRNSSYTLSANTYYKFSVWVKTYEIENENDGASVVLTYGDEKQEFLKINTNNVDGVSEFREVIFYIKATESTNLNVLLGLGDENTLCTGIVFFDNVTLIKLDSYEEYEKDYNANKDSKLTATVVSATDDTNDNSEDNKDDNKETTNTTGGIDWLLIPSIITALAILIAIIGFVIRKINFKHHTKVKTSYDRKQTLIKELDKAERIRVREELLNDLNNDLAITIADIEKFDKESSAHIESIESRHSYEIKSLKDDLKELNKEKQAKLDEKNKLLSIDKINVDKAVESNLNLEISKISKNISNLESKLNKVTSKIDKVKSSINEHKNNLLEQKETIEEEIRKTEKEIKDISSEGKTYETSRTKKGLTRNVKSNKTAKSEQKEVEISEADATEISDDNIEVTEEEITKPDDNTENN